MSRKGKKPFPEALRERLAAMSPDEVQAFIEKTERELAETQEALARHDAWIEELPKLQLWEDLQVLAFELHDKLDEVNDKLKVVERNLAERHLRPGWVAFSKGALIWDGKNLLFDSGKGPWVHLLHTAKGIRLPACDALQHLFEELTRERQPV